MRHRRKAADAGQVKKAYDLEDHCLMLTSQLTLLPLTVPFVPLYTNSTTKLTC